MAKLKGIDGFADEIQKILDEYSDDITDNVREAVKKVAKAGANAVKQEAQGRFNGSGKYAKGWKSKVEENRLGAEGWIYNNALPGLPHLLEFGHAKRGGGRVPLRRSEADEPA